MTAGTGASRRRTPRRLPLGVLGATAALLLLAGPAAAVSADELTFTGSLDDRPFTSIDANSPHELDPERGTIVSVEVSNNGDEPVEVRSVRLSATVLGLAFLNYTTRVDLVVEPGETATRTFALDLGDLGGQARGLLPGQVELLDIERDVLASRNVPLDVNGDVRSVFSVFALGVGAITALLFVSLIVRLGAGRLPANRWSRAWRFGLPGAGLGLTASLTLSALGLVLPSATASTLLVVVGVLVGVAVGYLSPAPDDGTGREDLYEEDFAKEPSATAGEDVGLRGLFGGRGRTDAAPSAPALPASAAPAPPAPAPRAGQHAAPTTVGPGTPLRPPAGDGPAAPSDPQAGRP